MRMSEIKIEWRLPLFFSLIIFLALILVIIDHCHMRTQYRLLLKVMSEDNEKLQIISDLRDNVYKEAISLRDSIILSEKAEIGKEVEIIKKGRQDFEQIKSRLGRYLSTTDDSEPYDRMLKAYHAMEPVTNRVISFAIENNDRAAFHVLMTERLSLQKDLLDALEQLVSHVRARQAAALEKETEL